MKFCKYLLGVHRLATNNGVRGELGRFPFVLDTICSLISFWHRLTALNLNNSLVAECVPALEEQNMSKNWIFSIKTILLKLNLQHIWEYPTTFSKNYIKKCVWTNLKTLYVSQWHKDLWNDNRGNTRQANKLRNYRGFKRDFALEPYLLHIKEREVRSYFTKLRISAHTLQIEKGRHYLQYRPVAERKCPICNSGEVESEVHFVLYCAHYNMRRQSMFSDIQNIYPLFSSLTDVQRYNFLMTVNEADTCAIVAGFVRDCFRERAQPVA